MAVLSIRGLFGSAAGPLSILALGASATRPTLDLHIIFVGHELFSADKFIQVNAAVSSTSALFHGADLGIGTVKCYGIPEAQAGAYIDIDSSDEAWAIRQEWGTPGLAIDVFIVHSYAGATVGSSPVNGSCHTTDEFDTGLIVAVEHGPDTTATTLAHETGHYLGLVHHPDSENLMYRIVPNGRRLEPEQMTTMKRHCILYRGCRPL